jgi:sensor histidine kinase YesM
MTVSTKAILLNKKWMAILHFATWALLFSLPLFYNFGKPEYKRATTIIYNWIPLAGGFLLFYLNYLFLINRFLFNKRNFIFVIANLGAVLAFTYAIFSLQQYLSHKWLAEWLKQWPANPDFKKWAIMRQIFSLFVTIGISLAIRMTQKWLESERERSGIENQFLKTELTMLRYQIQPHFFFNSLNNIYSLIDLSPEKAKQTVHGLGKLMRYLLYETSADKVDLTKEITFLQNFIHLMKIRVSDRVRVETSFPDNGQSVKVAPLMFVSMIENAFKHGVSSEKPSEILITMRLENNKLLFIVQNSYFPKNESDKGGSGVGMENLRNRLEKIYPGAYELHQNKTATYFTSTLSLSI